VKIFPLLDDSPPPQKKIIPHFIIESTHSKLISVAAVRTTNLEACYTMLLFSVTSLLCHGTFFSTVTTCKRKKGRKGRKKGRKDERKKKEEGKNQ
jgi:hypothetical protein